MESGGFAFEPVWVDQTPVSHWGENSDCDGPNGGFSYGRRAFGLIQFSASDRTAMLNIRGRAGWAILLFSHGSDMVLRMEPTEVQAMKEWIIIMAAANRAGILAAVTKAMAELGGDLREASQTVVRGFFTMIFSADFPESMDQNVIRDHLQDACRPFGIELTIRDPASQIPVHTAAAVSTRQHRLRIGGRNQPGVLRKLSQIMSMRGIDITGMHAVKTEEGEAFEMVLKLALPANCPAEMLLHEIENAGRDVGVTADIRSSAE